jgi:hypothetical protein
MIILAVVILLAVVCVVGCLVCGLWPLLDFLVFPAGTRGHRTPTWLVLALVAVCLTLVVFLQHGWQRP